MSVAWIGAHGFPVRVYYEDTDFSGVVYHAAYLRFMERGRTEFLRARGLSQSDLYRADGEAPAAFAVRHMTIAFHAPARMDDALSIETRIDALGGASVTMLQRVRRDATVLVEASVRLGLVAGGRARRLPGGLVELLSAPLGRAERS